MHEKIKLGFPSHRRKQESEEMENKEDGELIETLVLPSGSSVTSDLL